jgi:FAD/FMN-containing dehydrogenase
MTSLASLSIPRLRTEFDGRVIAPGDPGYDKARTVVMGGIDRRPAVIIRPADAAEVARVVSLARETGQELAIRSGGHSGAGHSVTDGGIVLDLANLRGLDIDAEQRTAWAQTGLTAGQYTTAAAAHGLATGFGDTGSVGIGGITLGGGVGYLSRKYGLTVDDVLAAELVTAGGELLRVDADNHPDLFWAIRGGGGNFGVATRFQYRLHELPATYGGMLMLPATAEAVHGFVAAAQAAPEELSTIANVMSAPPMPFIPAEHHGKLVVMGLMCFAGTADAGERAVAPFRALGTPLADMLRPISYQEMYPPDPEDYHPTAAARNLFIDGLDRAAAEMIIDQLQRSDAAMRAVQLRVLGGAISRVSADATAYAHRARQIMVNVAAFYTGPEDKPVREAWVDGVVTALRRQGDSDAYVNFVGDEGEAGVRAAYPESTWDRLAEVKRRYDPTNLFRLNQNIPPA